MGQLQWCQKEREQFLWEIPVRLRHGTSVSQHSLEEEACTCCPADLHMTSLDPSSILGQGRADVRMTKAM